VNVLYEDHAGQVWLGTDGGLFRLDESSGQAIFRLVSRNLGELEHVLIVRALAEDKRGQPLGGTQGMGLLRLLPDGRIVR